MFASPNAPLRESIWWLHENNRALRVGDWKIVAAGKGSAWELYDLSTDRAEAKNLAREKPDKVRGLAELWTRQTDEFFAQARKDAAPAAAPRAARKPLSED